MSVPMTMLPDQPERIPELEEIERVLDDDWLFDEEPDTLRCPVPEWSGSEP